MVNRKNLPVLFSYSIMLLLFILTIANGFFWDTVQLGSEHANYYFRTNFSDILLPNSIDSGHVPAFGMYLALIWKIFGRSLVISHMAMAPFIFGIMWQLQKLVAKFIREEYKGWALLLVFIDPTLLSQITLISPDVPLVFFFLMGLNALSENRKILLTVSIVLLFLTSMRGMMISFCLLITDVIINISFSRSFKMSSFALLKRSLIYMPAFLLFMAFSIYHYLNKGWIAFHKDSPWAEMFEKADIKGILYNIGILGWRIIDFGRIGIWIVALVLVIKCKKQILQDRKTLILLLIFTTLLVILSANMLWAKNLLGHRYLLPVYLSFSLLCARILFSQEITGKLRITLITVWLVLITTGNLWVYPERTAQGWDSTLGHLPYYRLRREAVEYLDKQGIDFSEVQSFFPNIARMDDLDLNNDPRHFVDFDNCCDYVFYSNVFNVSDKDYDIVRNQYSVIKHFRRGLLYVDICKKK